MLPANQAASWWKYCWTDFLIQRCLLSEEETIICNINPHYLKTPTFASSTGGLGELGGLGSIQFQSFQLLIRILRINVQICKYCWKTYSSEDHLGRQESGSRPCEDHTWYIWDTIMHFCIAYPALVALMYLAFSISALLYLDTRH